MRLRNNPQAKIIMEKSNIVIKNIEDNYFQNNFPTHLEIGMGKGDFIIGMALKYPEINFIGLEKFDTVLVKALKKIESLNIKNIRLISIDALEILDYFKENSFKCIYLNFSDPWPKKRHAKRRLTYKTFLDIYKKVLKDDGMLKQKTDSKSLFESSLISYNNYGTVFEKVSVDLHNSEHAFDNVQSEYERKFSSQNKPIYAVDIKFKKGV